jgi:hypothetical protein
MAQVRATRIELDNARVLSVAMGETSPMVARTTRRVLNRAEVLAPVDTGNMRASHSMTMRVTKTQCVGRIEVAAKYAEMVHGGTDPHKIQARTANALSFRWGRMGGVRTVVPKKALTRGPTGLRKTKKGVIFYVAKGFVQHPGTKARPWLFKALKEVATLENFEVDGLSLSTGVHPDYGL